MKKIVLVLILLMAPYCFGDMPVDMTTEQLKNIDIIHCACTGEYSTFGGFRPGGEGMMAIGIEDDDPAFQTFVNNVDLTDTDKVPRKKDLKKLRTKLKDLGLNNRDLELMGLEL